MRSVLCAFVLALAACGAPPPAFTVSPAHGSMFGQYAVKLSGDFSKLGAVSAVTVGGVAAYDLHADAKSVTATVQGAASPGDAEVVVTGAKGAQSASGVFSYDPPAKGVPLRWMAFGASLTQGTQSNGIDAHTQIFGYAGQLAKAAGVFLALPLFKPTFVPPTEPSQLDHQCNAPPMDIGAMMDTITDPISGETDLGLGRIDPSLKPRDVAVGGETVDLILHGGSGQLALLEHVVEDPEAASPYGIMDPLTTSQIDRIEALDPDVGFSADLLANDLDSAVTESDDLHPEEITPLDEVRPLLTQMMARLGKLHGQFFIANMPSLTFVPNVVALHHELVDGGHESEADFQAKKQQIDDLTDDYDQALADEMRPYPNLHLVDFKGAVDGIRGGLELNGDHLTVAAYGGFLSLDGLHFSDTGYALLANAFIDAMNPVLKSKIPRIDLAAVEKNDALSPSHLRALGLACVPPP